MTEGIIARFRTMAIARASVLTTLRRSARALSQHPVNVQPGAAC